MISLSVYNQLVSVMTDISNLSQPQESALTCFIPVHKKSTSSGLDDSRPVALTPSLMKCFDKLVLQHIKDNIPAILDPH